MLPFFVYFDLHPGSTLCGPNSRFWDAERIFFSLLASANFERAIARRPPIDMCDSLFRLHNVDPAAAGRRVTVDGDGAEWTVPCVRGGQTTKEKWRRLQEEAENGTISDEDAEELTYLLACCHLGGQMTREKWGQLLADEEAGTIGMKDRDYLAYLRGCAARGGRATGAEYKRLSEADTLTEPERAKLEGFAGRAQPRAGRKAGGLRPRSTGGSLRRITADGARPCQAGAPAGAKRRARGKKSAEIRWGAVTTLNDELAKRS